MFTKNLISVSAAGTGLVGSSSLLFFDFHNPININEYTPEDLNSDITPSPVEPDYSSKTISEPSKGFNVVSKSEPNKTYFLHPTSWDLDDFSLKFKAQKSDYLEFDKKEIKIDLFTSSVWSNSSKEDEYGTSVTSDQMSELFSQGLDELKIKQLLLSLSIRRRWAEFNNNLIFWSGHNPIKPTSLDDLKGLKIKYFKDFESLKNYVHAKVKSCTGEKKSCVTNPKELSIIDQDRLSFFKEN